MKYRIITDAGNPHIEVTQADSEEEFLDLLTRLNSLTAQDVMVAACSDRKEMLTKLIEQARRKTVAGQLQELLSAEMLRKISSFEIEKASLQKELEETRKALWRKEIEKQELQDGFCAVMAQHALGDPGRGCRQHPELSKVGIEFDLHRESRREFGPVK